MNKAPTGTAEAISASISIIDDLNNYKSLVAKYEEYISFLNEANETPIRLAWVHGWRSPLSDLDKGIKHRTRIQELKDLIER